MADQDNDIDNDVDNDVDSADAGGDVASNDSMPPAMTSKMKMPQPTMNPVVAEYLKNKQDLAAAQKQASNNEMLTGLARAGATLSAGLSRSNTPVNQQPFDAMASADQQPVTNVLNQQKSQAQDLQNQQSVLATQKQAADLDPNSDVSKQFRATLKANFPQIAAAYGDSFDNLSASDSPNVFRVAETKARIDEHRDEMNAKAADRRDMAANRADAKSSADENKALNYVTTQLDSARGDAAVKQAQVDLYSTKKINSLINMYGDPNKLSESQVKLLASEIAKVATGGVPGQAETEGITPNTLRGRMSQFLSNLTNNPTPANAAEFVDQYKDYAGKIAEDARSTIKGKLDAVIETHKKQLGDENYQNVKKQYYNRYGLSDDTSSTSDAQDHASRAIAILAKRQAARQQQNQQQPAPLPQQTGSSGSYAYGGVVQAPAFHQVHQQIQPHFQHPKPIKMAAAPVEHIPVMDKPMTAPMHFAQGGVVHEMRDHLTSLPKGPINKDFSRGGQVPGQPMVQGDSPVNDTVKAMVSPGEVVIPRHIMQSKDPAMAAYIFVRNLMGNK